MLGVLFARRAAMLLAALAALVACEGVSLPFLPTPTPPPTPPPRVVRTPAPTPTPTPRPTVEVKDVRLAIVDTKALSVAVAFLVRNPNTAEWLLQASASGTLTTPDGRLIPQARPTTVVDLAPGEEKWFTFPSVDTFGSVVGKTEVKVSGGQWLPANVYPYPGGVPTQVLRGKEPTTFIVTNNGDLGVNGVIRGYGFSANEVFLGLVECPQRLYPARLEVTVACGAARPEMLQAPKLLFAIYADLRPVLVLPTPTPSPSPGAPTPTPTGR